MSSLPVFNVASYFSSAGFLATALLNPFLIFLTLFYTNKIDKDYKKLMISFSVLCLIFSFIEMLVHPFYHSYNGGLINFNMVKWEGFSKELVTIVVASYSGVYAIIVAFFTVLFVFRYWTMLSSPFLRVFGGWKVWFLVIYAVAFGATCGSIVLHFGRIDEYSQDYLREVMREQYDVDINETSGFAVVAYVSSFLETSEKENLFHDQNGKLRWNSFIFSFGVLSLFGTQFSIVAFCGLQIHWKLNELLRNASASHRKLQQQFFKCLVLQVTSPTLTYYIPAVAILIVPFLDIRWSIPSGLIVCSFSFYPPIDSAILMIVVSEYKRAIHSVFKSASVSGSRNESSSGSDRRRTKVYKCLTCL